jgi:ATP synthase protein I
MSDEPDPERLRALEKRISAARGAPVRPPKPENHFSQAHAGWRMVTELVAGIGIGFGIGLGLDALFDTRPIFLVGMTLLGFAAGVRVMMGTAREMQRTQERDALAAQAERKRPEGAGTEGNGRGGS